jgi:hypothetical protein
MKNILFLFILILASCQMIAQQKSMRSKIDPLFLSLIDSVENRSTIDKKCAIKKTAAKINKQKKLGYRCFIYTKDAGSIRGTGITINSILPTFVTAIATLEQITQLSKFPTVTYIEMVKSDALHQ